MPDFWIHPFLFSTDTAVMLPEIVWYFYPANQIYLISKYRKMNSKSFSFVWESSSVADHVHTLGFPSETSLHGKLDPSQKCWVP